MKESLSENRSFLLFVVLGLLSLVVWVVSLTAVGDLWGGAFLAYCAAFLLCFFMPQIAVVVAAYATYAVWGWEWWFSLLFFFWPLVLVASVGGAGALFGFVWVTLLNKIRHSARIASGSSETEHLTSVEDVNSEGESVPGGRPTRLFASVGTLVMWGCLALLVYGLVVVIGLPEGRSEDGVIVSDGESAAVPVTCMDAAVTTYEMLDCYREKIDVADAQINVTYNQLMAMFQELDSSEPATQMAQKLRLAERAWIKFRDANCDSVAAQAGRGTMGGLLYSRCRVDMTLQREEALRQMLTEWRQRGY